jgi:hypothetical protein
MMCNICETSVHSKPTSTRAVPELPAELDAKTISLAKFWHLIQAGLSSTWYEIGGSDSILANSSVRHRGPTPDRTMVRSGPKSSNQTVVQSEEAHKPWFPIGLLRNRSRAVY